MRDDADTTREQRLEAALRALERHVALEAMDVLIEENGRTIGWKKSARLSRLLDEAREALS